MEKNKLKKLITGLDNLAGFEPIGLPHIVVAEGDWRPCNARVYDKYLEDVQQIKPSEATAFVEGPFLAKGHFLSELEFYVPIQFYKKREQARK
ncbi:hypothetical protein A3K73_04365 [Candidatus Pacearchaeota archaeon RBG_13_36_9]|nr:MAG: hypothetical protein A3K73_04365 [Candidatus Pacearchaeota archaeon RBG_13_36_9]